MCSYSERKLSKPVAGQSDRLEIDQRVFIADGPSYTGEEGVVKKNRGLQRYSVLLDDGRSVTIDGRHLKIIDRKSAE